MLRIFITSVACVSALIFFLSCNESPTNPFSADKADISLILMSSNYQESDTAVIDTVGKVVRVGLCLYLTQHIDYAIITIGRSATQIDTAIECRRKGRNVDTVFYNVSFSEAGDRIVIATGYVGKNLRQANAIIHVLSRPVPNHPPKWNNDTIELTCRTGSTVSLSLADKCRDPDNDSLSFRLLPGAPDSDTILGTIYSFTPSAKHEGALFPTVIVADAYNELDTLTIKLSINVDDGTPPVLKLIAPEKDSTTVGESSYRIKISATDPSGIASVKCLMGADTFSVTKSDSIFAATVTGLWANQWNAINFIVTDASSNANKNSLMVHIKYDPTIADNVPPAIIVLSPSKDTIVDVDSCRIQVKCTDASGIASVTFMSATGVETIATRLSDTIFITTVKGLSAGKFSTITIFAVDAATAANHDTVFIRIKYDNDRIPPHLVRLSPVKDSISINSNSTMVRLAATDASGIALVTCSLGSNAFSVSKITDSIFSATVTGLVQDQFNTIFFIAADSSLAANKCTLSVHIKFDPTILDSSGPVIFQKIGPPSGSVITAPIFSITDSIVDPSGIDSVYWTLNGVRAGAMTLASGSTTKYTLIDTLIAYRSNRIVIYAIDRSTNHNRDSAIVILDYNIAPAIRDTTVSAHRNSALPLSIKSISLDGDPLTWSFYQYPHNGTISGTLPSITYCDTGYTVSDSFLIIASDGVYFDTAKVIIDIALVKPNIVIQPKDTTVNKGQIAFFNGTLNTDVNPKPTFYWQKQGSVSSLACTLSTFMIVAGNYSDSGNYRVIAKNSVDSSISLWAKLMVNDVTPPIISLFGSTDTAIKRGSWIDPGITINEDNKGDLYIIQRVQRRSNPSPFDSSKIGRYTLTYSVKDLAGNASNTINRIVRVEDWERVVSIGQEPTGNLKSVVITVNGDIYAACDLKNRVKVIKLAANAAQWVTVGGDSIGYLQGGSVGIDLLNDKKTPVIAFAGPPNNSMATANVLKFNGSWIPMGNCPVLDIDDYIRAFSISTINNAALLTDYYYALFKLADSCLKRTPANFLDGPSLGDNFRYDNSNRLYSGVTNNGSGDIYISRFNGVDSWIQWSVNIPGFTGSKSNALKIIFDENNICFAMRTSDGGSPMVWKTADGNSWQSVGSNETFFSGETPIIELEYSEDGNLYAGYSFDPASAGLYINKLNNSKSTWEPFPASAGPSPLTGYLRAIFLKCFKGSCYVIYQTTSTTNNIIVWKFQPQ